MPKLTDAQLVILSTAAQRQDGCALPTPKSLKAKGAALTKTLEALRKKGFLKEKPATADAESWREDKDRRRMTLVITKEGLAALDAGPDVKADEGRVKGTKAAPKKREALRKADSKAPVRNRKAGRPKGNKVETILGLLKRSQGARIEALQKATGWQPHSVRAAITGLRKRGIEVMRARKDGITTYYAKAS